MAITQTAEERPGLPVPGRVRSPLTEWLLTIVTLGVYGVVHHWLINRELRDFGVDVDPTKAALAMFPGGLVVVPYLVTVHRTGERIGVAQETIGLPPSVQPVVGTIASPFAALHIPYLQSELNRAWRAERRNETDDRGANR